MCIRDSWAHNTSNGTTWQVADINSGSSDGLRWSTNLKIVLDGVIYFSAYDGSSGDGLWAHNTSNGTTWQVADINSGPGSSNIQSLIIVGDSIYFSANHGSTGKELWAHDGSNHSTWQVTDINSGNGYGTTANLGVVGATLYFIGDDGSTGYELWAHDLSLIHI